MNVTSVTFNGTQLVASSSPDPSNPTTVIDVGMTGFISAMMGAGADVVHAGSFSVVVVAQGGTSASFIFNLNADDDIDPLDDPGS